MNISTEYIGTNSAIALKVCENLKMLFGTYKGSNALCLDFGIDNSVMDQPIKAAEALLTSEIITAATKYEPRADIADVKFSYSEDGEINIKVVWNLVND